MTAERQEGRWPLAVLTLALAAATLTPIRSYDYFWHLATGRWILEHGALPATDPFALASDPIPWINGEWLFQIGLTLLQKTVGHPGVSVAVAVAGGILLGAVSLLVSRIAGVATAVALAVISWHGAVPRLDARPELAAIVLITLTIALLLREPFRWRDAAFVAALSAVWINLHPSALLAPVLAGLVAAGHLLRGERSIAALTPRIASVALAAAALLINPYGWRAIAAPLHLASAVTEGSFVNLEWLPSSPLRFPVLYLALALSLVAWARSASRRRDLGRLFLLLFLGALAIRFVRNHGIFFVPLPLLLAPWMPVSFRPAARNLIFALALAILAVPVALRGGFRTGADPDRVPIHAVEQLTLPGNIYNPDQFGGYLIWKFYPERRVLTDGRNELHRSFLREFESARGDARAWAAMFERYRLTLAVEEYREGSIEIRDPQGRIVDRIPPSLAYFPFERWALIAFDDTAMIFARRQSYPAETLDALEYRTLLPQVPGFRVPAEEGPRAVAQELERARRELGDGRRLRELEELYRRRIAAGRE